MRILKTLGIVLLALIALLAILSFTAPTQVITKQTVSIEAPQNAVFTAVNDLEQWPNWSPWNQRDATIKTTYSEKATGADAYYTWTSENSGTGKLTITDVFDTDSLYTFVEFDGQGSTHSNFHFVPTEDGTDVTWTFNSAFPRPFNVFLLFQDFGAMIDVDYAEGLGYLKAYVEEKATAAPQYEVQMIDFPATYYLVQKDDVSIPDAADHFQTVMPKVGMAFFNNQVEMAGAPSGLYYSWDEEAQMSTMALGIPAAPGVVIDGLEAVELPAAKALKIDYYGPYGGTGSAHYAMDAYAKANDLTIKTPVLERYVTDPSQEPDSTKWLTEVVYMIE